MSEAMKALESVGVRTTEEFGRVRLLMDIMGELAVVWSELSDEDKEYVSVSILGTEAE